MGITSETTTQTLQSKASALRRIDVDVHNDLPSFSELIPFLGQEWHSWIEDGKFSHATRSYSNTGSGRMDDAVRDEDGLAAGEPSWVVQQLLEKYRIDIGVLTGSDARLSIQHNYRAISAVLSAYNDWTLETWVRPYDCFKGSILITCRDVEAAVREIHRLGDDPGIVQVIITSAASIPYGNRYYWPIYAAAVEHGLPVAIHVGAEGIATANPPTSVGYPEYYLEFHTDHSLTMMAHCVSLVTEGVFEEFPSLRYLFIEGGICWVPHVMWRLDRLYPALKRETPWLKHLPSEYIMRNCYFSSQPIEEPDNHQHLLEVLAMLQAETRMLFASDYPHWDFDNPLAAFTHFPRELKQRIFVDNALDLYGERLLVSNT